MYIRNKGYVITILVQAFSHSSKDLCRLSIGHGQPHYVTARIFKSLHLRDQKTLIMRIHVGHGLYGDGISPAYGHFSYFNDLTHIRPLYAI